MLTSFGPNAYFFLLKSGYFSGQTPALRLQKSRFSTSALPVAV
ncbi:hypothetical protein M125_2523 [Bacteroides fragilis str. 3998T(B)3]|uniref:Uncharacterized protein n=1 Tax=Bacteroides fragilis str. 3998T(B)3 TaxID=1339316 RepID=A0A015VXS2_BACFG|nr:hypothetical protein M125_2523 [Bacteroides fragilis str. 3998T(B)3]